MIEVYVFPTEESRDTGNKRKGRLFARVYTKSKLLLDYVINGKPSGGEARVQQLFSNRA